MSPNVRPPRLARAFLARVLPSDVRDGILGDLEEVFRRDCGTSGVGRARAIYWRKTMSFASRFAAERLRGRRPITLGLSWFDFKLGFRMLGRYPGLTLVGGLAMTFAIAVGAGLIQFLTLLMYPTLPLADGDRVVRIRLWDMAAGRAEQRMSYDLDVWRNDVQSLEDLGAFRTLERNLIRDDGAAFPVVVAEVSASTFRVARIPPALGRALVDTDEQPDAPMAVVIGHDVWQTKFAADPGVVGRPVRVGSMAGSIVGVMPAGFEFPINHDVWLPLRLSSAGHGRRQGPGLTVFGRLTRGAGFHEAQVELSAMGRRASAAFPDTHEHLRPQVLPYAELQSILGGMSTGEYFTFVSLNVFFVLALVVLMCSNVALLMFARATTRESELIVRTALGASRRRVVMQLFSEALVLAGVATVIGLAAASRVLQSALSVIEIEMLDGRRLPFWYQDRLMPTTILAAVGLTVLCAVITGVGPALKIMKGLGQRLRQTTAGGGGLRFGGVWTAVIVTQVAVTVAFPAVAFYVWRDGAQIRNVDVGFPGDQYLAATIEMDRETEPRARFQMSYQELERRLMAEPAVAGVTVASLLPRMYHPRTFIEVDEGGAATRNPRYAGYGVGSASVDVDFFDVLRTPMLDGRGFLASDIQSGGRVAIVNQSFVRLVLGGRNPIGRRLRELDLSESGEPRSGNPPPGPWLEIIGVVRDMGIAVEPDPKVAGFYVPLVPGKAYPVNMAVHVKGDAQAFAPRLRAIGITVDPALRIDRLVRMDEVNTAELQFIGFWFRLSVTVSAVALLLSLAGIYSVMAFTVSRRTREIGIRIALGARPRRVILAILRRPLTQVGGGLIAGGCMVAVLNLLIYSGVLSPAQIALTVGYALLMAVVCLLACVVPVRRALRVEPTEALRADG
jgi:predicted permease